MSMYCRWQSEIPLSVFLDTVLVWKPTNTCKSWFFSKGDLGIPNHQNHWFNGWFVPTITVPFQLDMQSFTQPFPSSLSTPRPLVVSQNLRWQWWWWQQRFLLQPAKICLSCAMWRSFRFSVWPLWQAWSCPGARAMIRSLKKRNVHDELGKNRAFTGCLGGCLHCSLVCIWEYNFIYA